MKDGHRYAWIFATRGCLCEAKPVIALALATLKLERISAASQ